MTKRIKNIKFFFSLSLYTHESSLREIGGVSGIMRNRIVIILLLLSVGAINCIYSQPSDELNYTKEISVGITKATNSGLIGGVIFKYSIHHRNSAFHFIGAEMVNIKHPKEERYYSFTGNTYIYGKSNYLYAIRGQYGRDWILFRKAPQQGVQINLITAIGPTIGVVAPYYIEYMNNDGMIVTEQYDATKHQNRENILGTGGLFQGLGQSNIVMGINWKGSLAFEFGSKKNKVFGLELGFMIEAYSKEIPIIPTAENYSLFPNAFATLYYGRRK